MGEGNQAVFAAPVAGSSMLAARARSLSDAMADGALALPVAVAYAKDIATQAVAFHRAGRAHGSLSPAWILIGPGGAVLPRPSGTSRLATPSSDVHDFGLLFQQMLTGRNAAEMATPASVSDTLQPTIETVRAAALRLADRCRRASAGSDLRRVATELRLLEIMLNSFGAGEVAALKDLDAEREGEAEAAASRFGTRMCPACGSTKLYEATHLTVLEKALSMVELRTYRCYGCCRRFVNVLGFMIMRSEND